MFPFYKPISYIFYPSMTLQIIFLTGATVLAISSTYKKNKKIQYKLKDFMVKAGE